MAESFRFIDGKDVASMNWLKKKSSVRRLKTARDIGKFMADYYYELDEASKSAKRKIAWCSSVGPAEILRGMGFLTYFPETHSAMLGTSRMAADLIPSANAIGYSPDICSYLTCRYRGLHPGGDPPGQSLSRNRAGSPGGCAGLQHQSVP